MCQRLVKVNKRIGQLHRIKEAKEEKKLEAWKKNCTSNSRRDGPRSRSNGARCVSRYGATGACGPGSERDGHPSLVPPDGGRLAREVAKGGGGGRPWGAKAGQ